MLCFTRYEIVGWTGLIEDTASIPRLDVIDKNIVSDVINAKTEGNVSSKNDVQVSVSRWPLGYLSPFLENISRKSSRAFT